MKSGIVKAVAAPDQAGALHDDLAEHDRGHNGEDHGLLLAQGDEDQIGHQNTEHRHQQQRGDRTDHGIPAEAQHEHARIDVGAQRDHFVMAEVQNAGGVVDQRVLDADQRINKAHGDAADHKLDDRPNHKQVSYESLRAGPVRRIAAGTGSKGSL